MNGYGAPKERASADEGAPGQVPFRLALRGRADGGGGRPAIFRSRTVS